MSLNVERSSSEPQLPLTMQDDVPALATWRSADIARRSKGSSRRVRVLAGAIIASCTLTGLLTWATTSIGPVPRVSITLASTDYRNHLNVPVNGYGDQAIAGLAAIASTSDDARQSFIRLTTLPIELSTADDFSKLHLDRESTVSIVYISAHGASSVNGPVLLPANAQDLTDAVQVDSIIKRMAGMPTSQHKVLVIDGALSRCLPSLGLLHNDFARQMLQLDTLIESIPNLVVIVSADVDQKSWVNPDQGITVYASALIDALTGNASDLRNDGWIDLLDIHAATRKATRSWTEKYIGELQEPLLLPSGENGKARSRAVAIYPAKQDAVGFSSLSKKGGGPLRLDEKNNEIDSPLKDQTLWRMGVKNHRPQPRKDLLGQWWRHHQEHKDRDIHPSIVAPVLWQHFEATLLKLEQFELSGYQDAANACARQLAELHGMLSLPTLIDSIACRTGILNPELVGFDPGNDIADLAKQLEISLSSATGDDAKRQWAAVVANQRHSENIAFLRHTLTLSQAHLISRLIRESKGVDRQRLSQAAALVDCIRDPVQPPPQIGLVIQFLSRDLPHERFDDAEALRISRWLNLCLRVESIAENRDWWAPTIIQWAGDDIARADHQRRLAGDLLYGDAAARLLAEDYVAAAEQSYAAVAFVAETISRAEAVRLSGRSQLRRLHSICSARLNNRPTPDTFDHVKQIVQLYAVIDEIESFLETPKNESRVVDDSVITKLSQLASRFEYQCEDIAGQLNQWQTATFNQAIPNFADLVAALSVDGGSVEQRISAWDRLIRFIASGSEDSESIAVFNSDSNRILRSSAAQGDLALAAWSSHAFDQMVDEPRQTKIQVQHRIKTFEADPQWWVSLQKAGDEIGRREKLARRPDLALIYTRSLNRSWNVFGSSIVSFDSAQMRLRDRQKSVGRYLSFQATRIREDGLSSLEQIDSPYYRVVSELLESDSIALLHGALHDKPESQSVTASVQGDPMGIDLIAARQFIWTTQQQDSLKIAIQGRAGVSEGYVTLWARPQGAVRLLQPCADVRTCWSIGSIRPDDSSSDSRSQNRWMVTISKSNQTENEDSGVEVFGYFRGRKLRHDIELKTLIQPDVQIINQPRSKGGRVAVRSFEASQSGNGSAVTIVLDCSGSMGAKPGEAYGADAKYSHAVAAVEKLLDTLPTGTDLCIWAFGQATGPSKTVRQAEQSIRQVLSSVRWDARDSQLRSQIVDSISYPRLEPWNESPLFAAMLAASVGLKDYDGTRSLIVITDGHDNRIANDPVANPLSLTEAKWLEKHFNGTGISVNVIAFRVENKDKQDVRQQLAAVQRLLPPGKFVEVEQTAELAETLRQLISVTPVVQLRRLDSKVNPDDRVKLAVSGPTDSAVTWTNRLDAGLYEVSTGSNDRTTMIEVRDGDQLVLADLSSAKSQLTTDPPRRFDSWPVMQHELQWCRQKQAGRWQVGLQPLVAADSSRIEKRLVLWAPAAGDTIAVQSPKGLWIEATQASRPLAVSWQMFNEQPGASFDLSVMRLGNEEPEFNVWVSEQPAIPAASLRKGSDFSHLGDLAPSLIQVSGGVVRLLSASIETHAVLTRPGEKESLPCLVLRAEMPPGALNFLRAEGLFFEGFDEQYFRELGHYTLRLWPVTRNQVDKSLSAIHLISIEDFKKSVEQNGGRVTFESSSETENTMERHVTAVLSDRSEL